MKLTHYIFVRRDLPVGVIAAMVTHAAGESAALYEDPYDGRFRHAIAVVLEAKNEKHLKQIDEFLQSNEIQRVTITESGGPYDGQLMAIGLVPRERDPRLNEFQTLKSCLDNPPTPPVSFPTSHETKETTTEGNPSGSLPDVASQGKLAVNLSEHEGGC